MSIEKEKAPSGAAREEPDGRSVYMAPMEAVTTWIYRRAHAAVYGAPDKSFVPFLEPHIKRDFKKRELEEILPEHNEGLRAVPQILTNQADGFLRLASALEAYGYQEVNLNLGCPSRTVVSKGKGSGFLAFPEELDRFLEEICGALDGRIRISVKTRIGKTDPEEFPRLLDIFNRYPLEELIIHPRVQADGYRNHPRMEVFLEAAKRSKNPVCYNGDLCTAEDIRTLKECAPGVDRMMIGRGWIRNPGLLCEGASMDQFWEFHQRVYEGYRNRDGSFLNTLFKMKELWSYQVLLFPDPEKLAKRIRKLQRKDEYEELMRELERGF